MDNNWVKDTVVTFQKEYFQTDQDRDVFKRSFACSLSRFQEQHPDELKAAVKNLPKTDVIYDGEGKVSALLIEWTSPSKEAVALNLSGICDLPILFPRDKQ